MEQKFDPGMGLIAKCANCGQEFMDGVCTHCQRLARNEKVVNDAVERRRNGELPGSGSFWGWVAIFVIIILIAAAQ